MITWVILFTEFNSEAEFEITGCLEAVAASMAPKISSKGNVLIETRVYKFAEFKYHILSQFTLSFKLTSTSLYCQSCRKQLFSGNTLKNFKRIYVINNEH